MSQAVLVLRANIRIASDVELARREATRYLEGLADVGDAAEARRIAGTAAGRAFRRGQPVGFEGTLGDGARERLLRESAFVQEVLWRAGDGWCSASPLMARAELGALDGERPDPARSTRPTPAPHVHGLHKYKARFFPRLARFLVREYQPSRGSGLVLDPFSGSGTLPVEAALLGHRTLGVDIDALSCRIAATKLAFLHAGCRLDPEAVDDVAASLPSVRRFASRRYRLPPWIRGKLERAGCATEADAHEVRIGALLAHVRSLPRSLRGVASLALSDALTRKFNVRMLGTGVGRFALDVGRADLGALMARTLRQAAQTRRLAGILGPLAPAAILRADATRLPLPDRSVDLVVTSPPYLPASSGRENYLVGKSIALTALGIHTAEEIRALESSSVGSMRARSGREPLPRAVEHLVAWLAADPLRSIKAEPTRAYYAALGAALAECRRVLASGGRAVFVIGKESVFYRFRDREVLYRVACDAIFREMASRAGFEVVEQLDLELDKGHRNARPRSLDAYYEAIIVLSPRTIRSHARPRPRR